VASVFEISASLGQIARCCVWENEENISAVWRGDLRVRTE